VGGSLVRESFEPVALEKHGAGRKEILFRISKMNLHVSKNVAGSPIALSSLWGTGVQAKSLLMVYP